MNAVLIGKGMYRVIVRSKVKRERLSRVQGIQIDGSRVIFPEWLLAHVRMIIEPKQPRKTAKPTQTELF